ncbi:MAG: hypothetical protein E6Q97_20320 [Desulfurellales bacterium]|jgi:hypothetical protein|nr:MAG: hypothetical protein E6Q97_20320 [Desulfurellales bacterium]
MTKSVNPLWTAYNNLFNEGGEGYNPHDQYITTGGGEPEWSKLDDRKYRLLRIMEGTSTSDPRYAEMEKEVETLTAAIKIAQAENI